MGSYALFPHQLDAAHRATHLLYTPPRRVVLHLPTGVGKTRTAMHVVCRHLREQGPTLVAWFAYTEELLDQAAAEFEHAWRALGDREIGLFRLYGSHEPELRTARDGLRIGGLSKASSLDRRDEYFLLRLADRTTLTSSMRRTRSSRLPTSGYSTSSHLNERTPACSA